jgi:nucleotide-binding universal stress UspA family protein
MRFVCAVRSYSGRGRNSATGDCAVSFATIANSVDKAAIGTFPARYSNSLMTVVYGTDLSPQSQRGITSAAALAGRLGHELSVVHVIDHSLGLLEDAGALQLEERARARIEESLDRVRAAYPHSNARSVVITGSPAAALTRFADEHKATLLVVSSAGHARMPLYRLGGTSERIARDCRCPLLVLRAPEIFEQWADGKRTLRILLGIDDTARCSAAIAWVKELRRAGGCDVIAARLYYLPDAQREYGLPPSVSIIDRDPEIERLLQRDLARRLGEMPGTGSLELRATLGVGRLADHLLDLAEVEKADLVVVGARHAKGLARLASVSSGVLHFGRMAVACIPTAPEAACASDELPAMRCILVATDLSPLANAAIPYAYSLVRGNDSEVFLLHVADPSGDSGDQEAEVAAQLRRAAAPWSASVATRTEIVRHTDVPTAILSTAMRIAADVICVASHGRSGTARVVLGSVAETVARRSHRPVLIVRPITL